MKYLLSIFPFLILLWSGVTIAENKSRFGRAMNPTNNVSIIELLSRPTEFKNKHVRVIGVADFDFTIEGRSYLFLTQQDKVYRTGNAVVISGLPTIFPKFEYELQMLSGDYVILEGIFRYRSRKSMENVDGIPAECLRICVNYWIEKVNRVDVWNKLH